MELLKSSEYERMNVGASHTAKEIAQQPRLWNETKDILLFSRDRILTFLNSIENKHDQLRIILTGAGTSAFVGDTVLPYLKQIVNNKKIVVESIATTNIVSNPYSYLSKDIPTIMISFARSGNSPESLAAIQLGEQVIDDFYGIVFTCNQDGLLAQKKKNDHNHLVIYMPEEANDQGFAMTSSFTTMLFSALLLFNIDQIHTWEKKVDELMHAGQSIISSSEQSIKQLANSSFQKVVYLGSGVFEGLAREASLKLLELTGGTIPSTFDTSLGFRHGPKSILDKDTVVFVFLSCNHYTRQYDLDILEEIYKETNRGKVVAISSLKDQVAKEYSDLFYHVDLPKISEDIFLTFPFILYAQTFAMYKSINLGFSPDNPSPLGVVNRVVKGVTIHPFTNEMKNGGDLF
ncbi:MULTISPECIES: SIS domain-containing protein [Bacillaceae]|uniref:Tagatose-6-phosphate ketose isomerase n=1 Tax=Gottfriedia luciferensis TaxID=178774 RepID=A0ABX2ZR29_9BACI|nr:MULTISPECIES: SIS domain-containing protein [Bacillaceae]ODG91819.1 tagatose-6-phosphate ketose isomerase [Gottfriedia luciferensis]PGZ94523.1 SIS domain-containing protein [Bacillus sp. AFS029533]